MNKNPSKSNDEKKSTKSSQTREHLTADSVSEAKRRARGTQARDTQEKIEEHYRQLKDNTNEWLEEGKKKFEETQDSFKEYTDELAENVRNNPLKAILIAGGIGFILSSLLRK
ncbi:DUF883 family protein [Legionella clemsonensis]|uniref:DUF883 domain-containing protein n=1 Tax=Legionella clemsonensis TaxID=1867846 RepID=A0A222P0F9_9GAMM|nr:DUF883 C-terminal domain-containing protein [Legionella clemsonensis]ASQ45330.1 hypothetical protein clem_03860 [Legionella clemsonensis]